jgi:hypothetical protein
MNTTAEGIREDLVRKLAERIRMQRLRHQMRRVRPDDRRRPSTGNDEPDAGPRQFTLRFRRICDRRPLASQCHRRPVASQLCAPFALPA